MKGKYLRKFGALVLTLLVLPGVLLLASTSAQAQRRVIIVRRPVFRRYYNPWWGWGYNPYYDYYGRYGQYVFDNSETAFNRGYQDGLKTGQGDAKHDRTYNPQRSHYYQEAGFGNFGEAFRSGFLRGYAAGFRS